MNNIQRYKFELSMMAFGYMASLLVWGVSHLFLADSAGVIVIAANALIVAGVIVATLGVLLFLVKFFRDIAG